MAKAQTFNIADQEYDPAIPIDSIREHPDNYNEGDIGAISESLAAHGFYGAVLVQRSTGYILVGNHRHRSMKLSGAETIPGFWLDCDNDEAKRIMAVDNRSAALATVDESKLVELLSAAAANPRGLEGTGYDGDDLDDMIARLNAPLVIEPPDSSGGYAESEEERAAREEKIGNYTDRKDGGALVEMILVFAVDDRQEVGELLDAARKRLKQPDARAADLILEALRAWE